MCECLKKLWNDWFGDNDEVIYVNPPPEEIPPRKYALIVGINKYAPELDADLNGCVNDAEAMRTLLIDHYNFKAEDIRVLTDERATKANIVNRLNWLMSIAKSGDELVFHYSGHGTQIVDRNGDEVNDMLDEMLCPHDLDWDDPLTDDLIGLIFSALPEDVNLTFICDACHSGTMSRELTQNPHKKSPRFIVPPFDIRARSLNRGDFKINKIGRSTIDQKHVLLSGCRDDQWSADAYIDGKWQGALTSSLIRSINNKPDSDWVSIHKDVLQILLADEFDQTPQLSGNSNLICDRPIFGGKK